MNNSDPNKIVLSGEQLIFWRKHSDFLNSLADFSDESGVLVLERKDEPFLGKDVHFDFFWDIVHGNPVAHSKDKNGKLTLIKEKGYTRDQILQFADYIGYDLYDAKSKEDVLRRFKRDVLEKLPLEFMGHGTNKPRGKPSRSPTLSRSQRRRLYALERNRENDSNMNNIGNNRYRGGKRKTRRAGKTQKTRKTHRNRRTAK